MRLFQQSQISKKHVVLFDIENDRNHVQSMSQVIVNMSAEASKQD
jgi:alpha-galactosidase/6-phospho-beta-glucosidase family protein